MRTFGLAGWVLAITVACGGGGADDGDDGDDAPPIDAAADAPRADAAVDAAPAVFGPPITLSDPANASFVPAIAWRAGTVVVAWHDFPPAAQSRVVVRAIVGGVPGPLVPIVDPLTGPKRPSLAATAGGFVLAYDATDASGPVIRAIDLDAGGAPVGTPVTVSAPGVPGSMPRVAAAGDDVVFAWTDGSEHYFARRGPVETVAAGPIGTPLVSGGILNFPRIAVTSTGVVLVVYRDGGPGTEDLEVLMKIRQIGGAFLGPLDISRSTGLLSDDVALALRADDTLDIVWVDQDPVNVNSFETTYATRTADGSISAPGRFGTQGEWSWTPSAVPGLTAVWHTGAGAGGPLWLAEAAGTPGPILAGEQGAAVAMVADDTGALHLVYVTPATPRQVRYSARP